MINIKNKKAQVTIFVILGIILVSSILAYLALKGKTSESRILPETKEIVESTDVGGVVEECIRISLVDATRVLGFQGGYIRIPETKTKTNFTDIAYGYYLGKTLYPTKEKMEEELAYYIDTAVPACFKQVKKSNLKITTGKISSKIEISDDQVTAKVNYPISVSREETISDIKPDYEVNIPIKLGKIYTFVDGIITRTAADPNYVPMSYLVHPVYNVTFVFTTNGEVVYTIVDGSSTIDKIPYTFLTATKTR